jgi:hypothetical protein
MLLQEIRVPINMIIPAEKLSHSLPYYCMRCRGYLFSVNKEIMTVWFGEGYPTREIPSNINSWVQITCRGQGCKRTFNLYFQA